MRLQVEVTTLSSSGPSDLENLEKNEKIQKNHKIQKIEKKSED